MSGEFVLYEKFIPDETGAESLYMSLTSDRSSVLFRASITGLTITESMGTGSPVVVLNMVDVDSALMGEGKLDYSAEYFISFGKTPITANISVPLRVSSVNFTNRGAAGSSTFTNSGIKVTFVHANWDKIMNKRHNRSWGPIRYSDVVGELASECGYQTSDIEPTNKTIRTIIQPHTTNLSMIRYIQSRAKSSNYDDVYEFGVDVTGNFFFKTLSKIMEENRGDALSQNIPSFKLTPPSPDPVARYRSRRDNNGVPDYFFLYEGGERYVESTMNGGGGITGSYYDFETGEYKTEGITFDQFNALQLGDRSPVKEEFVETSKLHYHGSSEFSRDITKNEISKAVNSYNRFEISTEGAPTVHIGDLVELILPTMFDLNPYSEVYSGIFVVYGVTHRIDPHQNSFITTLDLYRNGFNGKTLDGYVSTRLGKFTS